MKKIIAIDLGGTHMRFAYMSNGKMSHYIKKETPKTKEKIMSELVLGIKSLINKEVKGIGISIAGVLKNDILERSPNLPLKRSNLKAYLKRCFKTKIEIENDANCAALAELHFGCKKNNFLMITLGTGIGGGIIIDKKLYKGLGAAGEFGHMLLDGKNDFEALAGTKRIKTLIKENYNKTVINEETVKEMMHKNTAKAKKMRGEIANALGKGVASLIAIFDPEEIVLSGGLTELGQPFIHAIKKETKRYNFLKRAPKIEKSKLKHLGILGASTLIP